MSEFSLITDYFNRPSKQKSVIVGNGDDAAIIAPPLGQQLVICTDSLISGQHFPENTPAHAIGWKSVAVNLSDLAAMGATPHSILLALNLTQADPEWLEHFSQGIHDCCARYQVDLIGGDTTKSPVLSINITALGFVKTGQGITRSGADVGDLIVVSHQLGDAAFALRHPNSALQSRLDYPTPRVELGQSLVGYASAMIDISDGLSQDLQHILDASGVGAEIQIEAIPMSQQLKQLELKQALNYSLAGGDDYELCFCINAADWQRWQQKYASQFELNFSVIGEVCAKHGMTYFNQQQPYPFNPKGYQHFA